MTPSEPRQKTDRTRKEEEGGEGSDGPDPALLLPDALEVGWEVTREPGTSPPIPPHGDQCPPESWEVAARR